VKHNNWKLIRLSRERGLRCMNIKLALFIVLLAITIYIYIYIYISLKIYIFSIQYIDLNLNHLDYILKMGNYFCGVDYVYYLFIIKKQKSFVSLLLTLHLRSVKSLQILRSKG